MKNRDLINAGVGAVIFKNKPPDPLEVLLICRGKSPFKGQWSIPGGTLEYGEPLLHAVRREVREETNIEIEILQLLDVYEALPNLENSKAPAPHYLMIDYLARWVSGIPEAGDDAIDAQFLPLEDAMDRLAWDTTRLALKKAAKLYQRTKIE